MKESTTNRANAHRFILIMPTLLLLIISSFTSACSGGRKNDNAADKQNKVAEKKDSTLRCDDIHGGVSSFTTINVRISNTYADASGYASLKMTTLNHVSPKQYKSFCVAQSEIDSKNQTFTLRDVPDEYLGNLTYDVYDYEPYYDRKSPIRKINGSKHFELISHQHRGIEEAELKNLTISNPDVKVAIVMYGSITITAKGKMRSNDGRLSSVNAEMYASDKLECDSQGYLGDLVYSNADCDITGVCEDREIDIHLKKGWNKVFFFTNRIITSPDVKDEHIVWYQGAG
jgi:hypothetical protein